MVIIFTITIDCQTYHGYEGTQHSDKYYKPIRHRVQTPFMNSLDVFF